MPLSCGIDACISRLMLKDPNNRWCRTWSQQDSPPPLDQMRCDNIREESMQERETAAWPRRKGDKVRKLVDFRRGQELDRC